MATITRATYMLYERSVSRPPYTVQWHLRVRIDESVADFKSLKRGGEQEEEAALKKSYGFIPYMRRILWKIIFGRKNSTKGTLERDNSTEVRIDKR